MNRQSQSNPDLSLNLPTETYSGTAFKVERVAMSASQSNS